MGFVHSLVGENILFSNRQIPRFWAMLDIDFMDLVTFWSNQRYIWANQVKKNKTDDVTSSSVEFSLIYLTMLLRSTLLK